MPATARPLAVVSDFDGTIVDADIGDALCQAHCPEAYAAFDRDWRGGKVSLLEGQRRIWPALGLTRARFDEAVDALLRFREGFIDFHAALRSRGIPFVIASNGFTEYIGRALARLPGRGEAAARDVFANRLAFDGDRVTPEFPCVARFGCGACGVCKGKVIEAMQAEGYDVAFVGDGGSDRCAAGRGARLFAVRGQTFEAHLRSLGEAHTPFETFDEVGRALGL